VTLAEQTHLPLRQVRQDLARYAHLFNDYRPDLDDISWSDDHDAYDARLAEIRREGISALLECADREPQAPAAANPHWNLWAA